MSKHLENHDCKRFTLRNFPCPLGGMGQFFPEYGHDEDFDFDDKDEEDPRKPTGQARTQEAISPFGVRVATMVSLQRLLAEGMVGIPTFHNGGISWMMDFLGNPLISAPLRPQGRKQQSPTLRGVPTPTHERRYASQLTQDSKPYISGPSLSDARHPLDGFVGNLIRAVALTGGLAATAYGVSLAKGLPTRGSRFAGSTPVPTPARTGGGTFSGGRAAPGGGGGKVFNQWSNPIFRPGGPSRRQRRRQQRSGSTLSGFMDID